MTLQAPRSFKIALSSLALLLAASALAQIPEPEFATIVARLEGDDHEAIQQARVALQQHVAEASKPGNPTLSEGVERQLLDQLAKTSALTAQLCIVHQLGLIGSDNAAAELDRFAQSDEKILAEAAAMAIDRIQKSGTFEAPSSDELTEAQARELAVSGENRAIRHRAFSTLAATNSPAASTILENALAQESESANEFLKIAIESENPALRSIALKSLDSGPVDQQIVVLGSLGDPAGDPIEPLLIRLLENENATLQLQTLDVIARLGTVESLGAALELAQSRDRTLSEAAADTIAAIPDPRIDAQLLDAAQNGATADRIAALNALSYRATAGATKVVNQVAGTPSEDRKLRTAAIKAMELVGSPASVPVLIGVIVSETSPLRLEAQRTLKRMSLRMGDREQIWQDFSAALEASEIDPAARDALILVLDAASTQDAIEYLDGVWKEGDTAARKNVIRALSSWRTLDAGYPLIRYASEVEGDRKLARSCFRGVGRVLAASVSRKEVSQKFDLANEALKSTDDPVSRKSIFNAFRDPTPPLKRYIEIKEVDPELAEKIREFAKN